MNLSGSNSMFSDFLRKLVFDLSGLDSQIVLLMVLIVTTVIVLDAVSTAVRNQKLAAGVSAKSITVSIDGSKALPVRNYVSLKQGLAGKPDAIVIENGYFIPIERKPLARKMHDRYVSQLLVYMRLIEEFEGKKPPYGYLILGSNCRRIKIENTPEKQAALQKTIDRMKAILKKESKAVAAPHPRKCAKCDVSGACEFAAIHAAQGQSLVKLSKRAG